MGYLVSDSDFPDGLPPGETHLETRRESFALYTDFGDQSLEVAYSEIARLRAYLDFAERRQPTTGPHDPN